jgi:hypothetical protein
MKRVTPLKRRNPRVHKFDPRRLEPSMTSTRLRLLPPMLAVSAVALAAAACGSSSSLQLTTPTIAPARVYHLAGFTPTTPVRAGRQTRISFTIIQPSGTPLTAYKQGSGPHNGVDLIIVRSDDSHLLYEDTDIAADGKISQPVVFPAPGRYRILIDAYPKQTSQAMPLNFQLFTWVTVAGVARAQPLPAFSSTVSVDGYRFTLPQRLSLHAIQAAFLPVSVRDTHGRPAVFTLWRGALAHAIFIRAGSLDYFHTHVCPPGATSCTSRLGATRVTGTSSTPGKLKVGVLVPVPGTWRLFLLTDIDGQQLTAPFTLTVS